MYLKTVSIVVILGLAFIEDATAQAKSSEQAILEKLFTSGYDRRARPVVNGSAPVSVDVNLLIRDMNKLDDKENEWEVALTFRQQWRDSRLGYSASGGVDFISLLNPASFIWRPDTFFSNEKVGKYHDLMMQNEFARIYPRGEIMHSARLSMKLSCPMNLQRFPFDRQTCVIRMASYGYTSNRVAYAWEKNNPVQVAASLMLPGWNMETYGTESCRSVTTTGEYSCLLVSFIFKRDFTPYLLNVYIPTTMMIIISWLSFWIDAKMVTARILLTLLTLLVLAIQTAEINKGFPPVNYTKSIDVWTGISLTFVMAALVEFIVVHYKSRIGEQHDSSGGSSSSARPKTPDNSSVEQGLGGGGDEEQEIPLKGDESGEVKVGADASPGAGGNAAKITQRAKEHWKQYVSRFGTVPEKIDGVARVAYPVAFLIFNILYWPVYS